jgi:cytochrome bd-type quinol oxidase subunit 2
MALARRAISASVSTLVGAEAERTFRAALRDAGASFADDRALRALHLWLQGRWPLPTWRGALAIGLAWGTIAVGFELGVGHRVDGKSWSELLRAYDVLAGNSGGAVILVTVAAPLAVRAARRRLGR